MNKSLMPPAYLKYEQLFFLLMVLVHAIPILTVKYFVTLDGPAHLYNAALIKNLVIGDGGFTEKYFYFNSNPEPNWTGHFMMAFLLLFCKQWLAEKIFLLIYVVTLALSFRMLVARINPESRLSTYLVFPFIFNMPFCFGFFNFSIGLPVIFFGIYFWLKHGTFNIRQGLIFFLFVLTAYFCHIFSCLVFLTVTGVNLISEWRKFPDLKKGWNAYRSKFIVLIISAVPVAVMLLVYFYFKGVKGYKDTITGIETDELFNYLLVTRTIICWIYDTEKEIAVYFSILLALLTGITVYFRFKNNSEGLLRKNDYWLAISMMMLVLFFVIPNNIGSGGFVSIRLLLFFHLFFLIWISVHEIVPIIRVTFSLFALFISLNLMSVHATISSGLDKDVKEYMEIESHIPEQSSILPLNYSDNWLHLNLSNYLGSAKNVIDLDNYEPGFPQFPLRWQPKAYPYDLIGDFGKNKTPCIRTDLYEKVSGLPVNYIVRWSYHPMNDSCSEITASWLETNYDLIFTSSGKRAEVFTKKYD